MTNYETKDSGTHQEYASGMKRDSQDGKPRFDLIRTELQPYEEQMIYRYAMLLARGAEKYSARNWEQGDGQEELDRAKASLLRHTEQLIAGETDEDHAAAIWFNTQAVEYFKWKIAQTDPIENPYAEPIQRLAELYAAPAYHLNDEGPLAHYTAHADGSVTDNRTGRKVASLRRIFPESGVDHDERSL